MPSLANRASLPARLAPTSLDKDSVKITTSNAAPSSICFFTAACAPAASSSPKPDVSTAEALKRTLLQAKSIGFTGQAESDDKLVAGCLLELRAEFFEDRLHCGGCVDFELWRTQRSLTRRAIATRLP